MKNTRGVCAALTAATTAAGTVAVRGAALPGVSVSTPALLKAVPVMCPLLYQTWPTPPGTRVGPRARRQKYPQLSPTCFLHWPCDVGQGLPEPRCLLLSTVWATSELTLERPVALISWSVAPEPHYSSHVGKGITVMESVPSVSSGISVLPPNSVSPVAVFLVSL